MLSNRSFRVGAGVAVVLVSFIASQALAYVPTPIKMTYSVELGGDNHAANWKAGTRVLYSGNSSAPNQTMYQQDLVNWSVLLKVEGDHLAADGHYYRTFGAANTVFNLELHEGSETGPIVNGAVFKSTINDGTGTDPTAAAAFALSFKTLVASNPPGRLIDKLTANGPRMEPIFTYPFFDPAKSELIGQGAGYKEWVRTGGNLSLLTYPGIGMTQIPTGVVQDGVGAVKAGLGVVPIAEGQIDMSTLPPGTYVLKVVPGNGNNVLRGDVPMLDPTNRPAFALACPDSVGGSITFNLVPGTQPKPGIQGRYVYYNNSSWDGNTPAITVPGDYNAICYDKEALLPGQTATCKNYINYKKGLNGIIIDALNFNRLPVYGTDLFCVYGNNLSDPFTWSNDPGEPTMVLRPGEGVNGSDRLILTWPDNQIPNSNWLLVALFAYDPTLGLPQDDFFIFGLAIGEANCNFKVDTTDEINIRINPRLLVNPAPVCFPQDINRDKKVDTQDQIIARNNITVTLNQLKAISWAPF